MKKHLALFIALSVTLVAVLIVTTVNQKTEDIIAATAARTLGAYTLATPTVTCGEGIPNVSLSWTASANASTYLIQRAVGQNSTSFSGAIMSQLKVTNYLDKLFAKDYGRGYYSYRIVAYSSSGTRKNSNVVSVLMPECKGVTVAPATTTPTTTTTTPSPTAPTTTVATTTTSGSTTPTPTPTPTPTTTTTNTTTATGKAPSWMKWGSYVGWQDNAMANFESLVGKSPQMEMVFAHWGNDQFPSWYSSRIKDKGRTMVLFWEAVDYNRPYMAQPEYSFDSVLAGKLDPYFTKFAADAKAYGGPIILIPYSEFNGDWFPWGGTVQGNTPAKYIAAYRYLHKFFVNVPNVQFAWVVNSDSVPDTANNQLELFYPGDEYVDMVGVDGFSFANAWMSFDQVFRDPITRLKVYKKPIYIFSMGAAEDTRKAAWITDALTVQLAKYPEVVGWLWFNENKENNWLINSSANALNAFKSALP